MFKRVVKFMIVYYLFGAAFLLLITSQWREEGVMTFHLEIIRTSLLESAFWLQAFVWPIFIVCYLPSNFICHA